MKISLFLFGLIFGLILVFQGNMVSASYNGENLITNSVFLDSRSMSASQIQLFLNSKGGQLSSRSFTVNCDGAGQQAKQMYLSLGAPCGGSTSAANIIYYSSQVYGVNPKVIITTMQKEQSLVTATNPTDRQYAQAMGYGCPTSGNCDDSSSFFWQIDNGTWVLRYHYERANGNMTWWYPSTTWTCGTEKNLYKPSLYPGVGTQFYDTNGTYYRTLNISNAATSAFYCYTPHAYNNPQGLYGREPYGTTGLYYSGSYNFVYFFELWFGNTQLNSYDCDSKISGITCVWSLVKSDGSQFLTSSKAEIDYITLNYGWIYEGVAFYASQTPREGMVATYRLLRDNQHHYTTDISEYNSMKSSGNWTDEGIAFYAFPPTTSIDASHRVYRLYNQSLNRRYWTADVNRKTSLMNNGYLLESSSFNVPSGLADLPVPATGRVNIYKLKNSAGYFYTTSLRELENVINKGYTYEGVLTTANSSDYGQPVYRLRYSGGYFYTNNIIERNLAVQSFGMVDEGIGFRLDDISSSIYRLANSNTGRYMYTSSVSETMSVVNTDNWLYEGVLVNKNTNPSPVYRFLNLQNSRHFYTIDINEATRITNKNWKYETVAFYANTSTGLPVYRLLLNDKHFYTTNSSEKNIAVSKYGYKYECVAYYASEIVTDTPTYRLQGGNDEYFFTTSSLEKDAAVSKYGYKYEGLGFYLSSGN